MISPLQLSEYNSANLAGPGSSSKAPSSVMITLQLNARVMDGIGEIVVVDGIDEGSLVGADDGLELRDTDGLAVGPTDRDGRSLGDLVGFAVGLSVGDIDGTPDPTGGKQKSHALGHASCTIRPLLNALQYCFLDAFLDIHLQVFL